MILSWTSLPLVKQRCIDQISLTFLIRNIEMTIKAKTDRHGLPMWRLWSCRIIAFKLYFCSHKRVFMRFSLFVRDKQRSIFWHKWLPIDFHLSMASRFETKDTKDTLNTSESLKYSRSDFYSSFSWKHLKQLLWVGHRINI